MITYDDKDKIIQACNVMLIQYRRNMCGCEFSHTSSTETKVEVLSFTYSGLKFYLVVEYRPGENPLLSSKNKFCKTAISAIQYAEEIISK